MRTPTGERYASRVPASPCTPTARAHSRSPFSKCPQPLSPTSSFNSSLTTMTPHVLTHLERSLLACVPLVIPASLKHTLHTGSTQPLLCVGISTPQAVSPVQAKAAVMRTWLKRTAPPKCNFTDSGGSIANSPRSVSVSAGSTWDIDQQDREWLQRKYPNALPGQKRDIPLSGTISIRRSLQ